MMHCNMLPALFSVFECIMARRCSCTVDLKHLLSSFYALIGDKAHMHTNLQPPEQLAVPQVRLMLAALNHLRSARLDELVSGRADAASGWSKVHHGCTQWAALERQAHVAHAR